MLDSSLSRACEKIKDQLKWNELNDELFQKQTQKRQQYNNNINQKETMNSLEIIKVRNGNKNKLTIIFN